MDVVDSKNWKVLDPIQLKGDVASRVAATVYKGKEYAYIGNSSNLLDVQNKRHMNFMS
jgi:hypothetical protein